jgi:hypothetical protein
VPVYEPTLASSPSQTSPNIRKWVFPAIAAYRRTFEHQVFQKAMSTCLTVSTRKPSQSVLSIRYWAAW